MPLANAFAIAAMLILTVALASAARAAADTTNVRLSAEQILEDGGGATDVRLDAERSGLVLYDHELIEDDGAGASTTARWFKLDRAPVEAIADDVRIRKVLHLDDPRAIDARLCVPRGVAVELNGSRLQTDPASRYPQIPVDLLREGDNEIVLLAPSGAASVKVAPRKLILLNAPERADDPPRSFRSDDGGRSWQSIPGEVMVRLHVVRHRRQGHVLMPVIALTPTVEGLAPIYPRSSVIDFGLRTTVETPPGTSITWAVRTGPCPAVDDRWSPWRAGTGGRGIREGHRYAQWRATLTTDDPARSPILKSAQAQAMLRTRPVPEWTKKLRVAGHHNATIRTTSMPFEYEDPDHPRMVALREKYKLDEVVAPGRSEMERMVLLRNWVARRLSFKAPAAHYPPWDADAILEHGSGFCVQYAVAFMQCATALGVQSRFVFGNNFRTGHEVAEFWSNEHEKWVYMDCSNNFHCLSAATGVPMSLMAYRDLVLDTYYPDGRAATWQNRPAEKNSATSPKVQYCYGTDIEPTVRKQGDDPYWPVLTKWVYLRYMPRNNFYASPRPVPHYQGTHWDWTGYWAWRDGRMDTEWKYGRFTARRADIEWTLNQTVFDATLGEGPGTVDIRLAAGATPYFDAFVVRSTAKGDAPGEALGAPWRASPRQFTWTLQPGRNRIEMRTRNTSGVLGPVSFLEVELKP